MTDERVLPHNLEAEKALLGSVLINAEVVDRMGPVKPAMFFRDAHQRIFSAMLELLEGGVTPDFVTLRELLTRRGEVEEVGGPAYISSLVDGVPRSANVGHYAAIVREHFTKRRLIHSLNDLAVRAFDGEESAEELIKATDSAVVDLQNGHLESRMAQVSAGMSALFDDLEHRVANRGKLTGIETGFESINELTMGWQRGDLIVLAARPSIGKTTLAVNSAVAAAQAGARVLVFSLEMRRRQLEYRMVSSLAQVPLSRILGGFLGDVDMAKVANALGVMGGLPLTIDDRAAQTVWDIRWSCRRARADGGLDLVVVDYVQLMTGSLERRHATRNEEITDISRKLKVLADELNAPILLLSQLNRASESRNDPRPKLSDLRESGALEQDADIVAFLHRKNHREGGVTNLIFEKQRNGPTGTKNLTLDRDVTTFVDGGEEPKPEEPPAPPPGAGRRRFLGRRS